ncbi:MAG TPA: hypothetical protein VIE63_14760 [Ramlibacter sp.]
MSIDLLPYGSPAPEPAPPATALADGQTLTLQLRARHATASDGRMAGTMEIVSMQAAAPNSLHAAVVAADATALTITFE